jgi:hypothetical protein
MDGLSNEVVGDWDGRRWKEVNDAKWQACGDGLDEQTAAAENAALLRLRLPNDAAMQYGPMLRLKLRWLHIIWPRRGRHARARTN